MPVRFKSVQTVPRIFSDNLITLTNQYMLYEYYCTIF